jgi:SAM-dependent methyltransferase
MNLYDESFFKNRQNIPLFSASVIVPEIINIFNPKSVIDFGCGMGEWLKVFQANNVDKVCGIDGSYINVDNLLINKQNFIAHDLNEYIEVEKFDVALCLEVAEHLNYSSSDIIVNSIVNSSENIIFGAAIPGQGGTGHINEQPHLFWADKFIKHGYNVSDCLRIKFMEDKRIPFWYRQNILVFTKNKKLNLAGNINFSVPDRDKEDYFE